MLLEIAVILALVFVNGLFAGAEMAVVTVRASRVAELVESGRDSARALMRLRADPERFLATVQVGISIVSAAAGAFGGAVLQEDLSPVVARVPALAPYAKEVALAIVVFGLAYVSLILGELVPKSLALRASENYALLVARPLLGLAWLVRPLVWFLMTSSNLVLRPFRDRTNFVEGRVSVDELLRLVDQASSGGELGERAGEIASRALELEELVAADVIIHRRSVVAVDADAGEDALRRAFLESGHGRIPVYEGSIDHVLGYVHERDALEALWSKRPIDARALVRPGWFVPESTGVVQLLRGMQSRRLHMAFVVDEHGGTAGIVTLEDLVEEIVGEIFSEHDKTREHFRATPDGAFVVPGNVALRDVDRALGTRLADERAATLGGLCIELAGQRIPTAGERFEAPDGTTLQIVDASARRVRMVRVRPRAGGAAARPE